MFYNNTVVWRKLPLEFENQLRFSSHQKIALLSAIAQALGSKEINFSTLVSFCFAL